LAHAFLWEYSDKRLKLAQLLGQLGVFLTLVAYLPGGATIQGEPMFLITTVCAVVQFSAAWIDVVSLPGWNPKQSAYTTPPVQQLLIVVGTV
jgi:hypothetical protein